jgi:membrane-associated phospholipid phosphatase
MNLLTTRARAYVNYGRWIAECPHECGSALKLEPGQTFFHCSECGAISSVEWPDNADEIWEALSARPMPRTRNWFPSGHSLALRAGCPHGQTVAELRQETMDNTEG